MSGLQPEVFVGSPHKTVAEALSEVRADEQLVHETISIQEAQEEKRRAEKSEIPPKISLIPVVRSSMQPKRGFMPVSAEEKKKNAALYTKQLMMRLKWKAEQRKGILESVNLLLKLEDYATNHPVNKNTFAYIKRQILLGNSR
ncbi:MAG: hypothetical protein SPL08_00710 [Pseudomonadota bacterium]|nr:hypothetical protein [Pseudomonadota bacterium]